MYTIYHLASAQEITPDILESIRAAFKSKPIMITVEEDEPEFELSTDMKLLLDERLQENEESYLTAKESISQLNKKYGV